MKVGIQSIARTEEIVHIEYNSFLSIDYTYRLFKYKTSELAKYMYFTC